MISANCFRSWIEALEPGDREALVGAMPFEEARSADLDWAGWAHPGQLAPPGEWRVWVIMAGRGFGKTRAGAEWIAAMARGDPSTGSGRAENGEGQSIDRSRPEDLRIALVAATLDEARRVMVEGESGLLAIAANEIEAWHPSRRLLRFRGGAQATLFSGASPEALRGPQHHIAWCDELAKWEKPKETWNMLRLGLRMGDHPRVLVTTTPRSGPVLRRIMAEKRCVATGGSTHANPHLPDDYLETMDELFAGTRLDRQELDGELLPDAAGALWSVELLERCRVDRAPSPLAGCGPAKAHPGDGPGPHGRGEGSPGQSTTLTRVLIGVDPPSGDGTCGIIACARDAAGIGHVLADHSVTGRSPEGWARAVAAAAAAHGRAGVPAPVAAESNQGGKMVRSVLHTADPRLRVRLVTAHVGKILRAEPVAHLFEAGKVVLHGEFPELEAELCGMIAGGDYEGPGVSPDRADAMVWALTELMINVVPEPSIRRL